MQKKTVKSKVGWSTAKSDGQQQSISSQLQSPSDQRQSINGQPQ